MITNNAKQKIGRLVRTILWVMSACGLVVLLVAAIKTRREAHCASVLFNIRNERNQKFLDRNDLIALMATVDSAKLKGRPVVSINLKKMEQAIEGNPWVRDAELFFDNNDVLHINVDEREPVARIFTRGGNSFYLDSSLTSLPLSSKVSLQLPVFTNFPSEKANRNGPDSGVLRGVRELSHFISSDSFWNAQIAQVDITRSANSNLLQRSAIISLSSAARVILNPSFIACLFSIKT